MKAKKAPTGANRPGPSGKNAGFTLAFSNSPPAIGSDGDRDEGAAQRSFRFRPPVRGRPRQLARVVSGHPRWQGSNWRYSQQNLRRKKRGPPHGSPYSLGYMRPSEGKVKPVLSSKAGVCGAKEKGPLFRQPQCVGNLGGTQGYPRRADPIVRRSGAARPQVAAFPTQRFHTAWA